MALILGKNAKLYYQFTGTRAAWPATGFAPNLSEVTNAGDVKTNLELEEADVSTRGSGGYKARAGTLMDGTVEFQMVWDTSDVAFTAIKTAFMNNTTIAVAVLSGLKSATGISGVWADFEVMNFSRNEELRDVLRVDVTLAVGYSSVEPAWITVTAS